MNSPTIVALVIVVMLGVLIAVGLNGSQRPQNAPRIDGTPELAPEDAEVPAGPSCEHEWHDDTDDCDPTRVWVCLHCATEWRMPRREDAHRG